MHVLTLGAYEEVDREAGIRAPLIALKGEGINGEVRQSWSVWGDTSPRNRPETTMNHLTEKTPATDDDGIDRRGFLGMHDLGGHRRALDAGGRPAAGHGPRQGAGRRARLGPSPSCRSATATSASTSPPTRTRCARCARRSTGSRRCPSKPAFMIHTGDISHLSKDQEFDDADQLIREAGLPVFYVPGEHDLLDDGAGKAYLDRYGKGTRGAGWYSFDQQGVHFIALVNVVNLKAGGLGNLGSRAARLAGGRRRRARPRARRSSSSRTSRSGPSIRNGAGAPTTARRRCHLLKRFGSVTVLNGHIHQVMQKVEGNVAFHTARSTAFPQPAPGTAPSPGPMKVPAGDLRKYLGIATVDFVRGGEPLAIIDKPLA